MICLQYCQHFGVRFHAVKRVRIDQDVTPEVLDSSRHNLNNPNNKNELGAGYTKDPVSEPAEGSRGRKNNQRPF